MKTAKGISNIVEAVVATGSTALADKLKELEADKSLYEKALLDKEAELDKINVDKKTVKKAFKKAKDMLMSGTLVNRKAIIENYVNKIIITKDKITVEFNVMDNYTVTEEIEK